MKIANINVKKLEKESFHHGQKGIYTDLIFFENRDGEDEYGNLGFVVQGISKERRDQGERGPIVGNWKDTDMRPGQSPAQGQQAPSDGQGQADGDDIPF